MKTTDTANNTSNDIFDMTFSIAASLALGIATFSFAPAMMLLA